MSFPRYLEKFTSSDGSSYSYTFGKKQYELGLDQGVRSSQIVIAGSSYPFDQLGTAVGPKSQLSATHKHYIVAATGAAVDTELDAMRQKLYRSGLGKLYIIDENGSNERWAWARLAAMPQTNWSTGDGPVLVVHLEWLIVSDFYNATGFNTDFTINATPKTITVTNSGNARVFDAIMILKGTYAGPTTIANSTNGYQIQTTRAGSNANHWLEIRAGRPSVRFSTDGGVTYAGDFALVTLPALQTQLMVFEPGNNTVVVTGANGSTLNITFGHPWE